MSVVVTDIVKRFSGPDAPAAVDGVSFEAKPGSITALLGPSGSGKSTLLRVIAGLERPDSGRVEIAGQDVTAVGARERNVGLVFQSYALFGHMTVHDNIGFGLKVRGRPKPEIAERVRELLGLVRLSDYAERFPSQLSGGQRQRVALARALATRPQLLLLDEPFGALDTKVRVELREWLLDFHRQTGVTTLLVTHDQEEAFDLAEHVVLLDRGKVAQAGAPNQLYDHPESAFVAEFLGGANVLRGHVDGGRARVGEQSLDAPGDAPEGARVHAFVRPRDIRVHRAEDGPGVSPARVARLTRAGSTVKVTLELPSGDTLVVHLGQKEADDLGLAPGEHVHVDLAAAKLFVEDYAI
ncbi:MAG: ABC transporter ATP-binding protein [Polyangiaceae bacterium]|nr:ABC transporter ATP-binding protein [Polyangiaceae bacterium]MCE7892060.1 ABC transporter ATP-binding protein [Sorangiineae bacterium PRO1]MCL4749973.1 ABC transporter ATP-binding protein [Myxococcales bacterium]